jgi:hypothetical protein
VQPYPAGSWVSSEDAFDPALTTKSPDWSTSISAAKPSPRKKNRGLSGRGACGRSRATGAASGARPRISRNRSHPRAPTSVFVWSTNSSMAARSGSGSFPASSDGRLAFGVDHRGFPPTPRTRQDSTYRAWLFRNTVLGETWVETGEAPDWQRLADRREEWPAGTVPAGGLFLTAGADVQKDRIEVDIWAWGRGLESWLVEHVVIEHGPGDPEAWAALDRLLGRSWPHARGAAMRLARLAIDTGYETSAVYAWSRRAGFAQVAPVKGVDGFNRASPVAGPTYVDVSEGGKRLRRGARLWTVAVSTF